VPSRGWRGSFVDVQVLEPDRARRRRPDRLESSIGPLNLPLRLPGCRHRREDLRQPGSFSRTAGYLMAIRSLIRPACVTRSASSAGQPDRRHLGKPGRRQTVELTANDNTIYNFIWLDTKEGSGGRRGAPGVLGGVNDFWYRWVADVGLTGEDKGRAASTWCCRPDTRASAVGLCRGEAEHLRQLAVLPRLPRRWLDGPASRR